MSNHLPRKDWKDQSAQLLKQLNTNRLDIAALFPNKEHISSKPNLNPLMKDNLAKFFNKSLDSLLQIEVLTNFLKQTPPEVIQENDKVYSQLKKLQQQAIFIQLRVKEILESKDKTYNQIKFIMGDLYSVGVAFNEGERLKSILDENRKIEQNLSSNFLSLEQLEETELRLKKEKGNIDQSFAQIISEKRVVFEKLNDDLMQLLSRSSLTAGELKQICLIIEEANQSKFKISHFRHVCDIRDSFRWIHLLDQFLGQSDLSKEKYKEMSGKMNEIDISKPIDFEHVKQKLARFIESLEQLSDMAFFRTILDPIKDIELTDPSIQSIIDFIRTSRWTIIVKHKLHTKTLTIEELEDLYRNAPSNKKTSFDRIFVEIKELYTLLKLSDNQLFILLKESREFLLSMDEESIVTSENQVRIVEFNNRLDELTEVFKDKLDCIEGILETPRYTNCIGLLAVITCASLISSQATIPKDELDNVELFFGTDDDAKFKDHPLVILVENSLNDKKIIAEFLNILYSQQSGGSNLEEKIDINTGRKYIDIMKSDKSPINYTEENKKLDLLVKRFEHWQSSAEEFVSHKYDLKEIEANYEQFFATEYRFFKKEYQFLMEELKELHFSSDCVQKLLSMNWMIDAMGLFNCETKKKKEEWEALLERGRDLQGSVGEYFAKVEKEIEKVEYLKQMCHQSYREKASYLAIQKLKSIIPECQIDIDHELKFFKTRLDVEEDLYERINAVIDSEVKLKISQIEKINEDIKLSGINFEDLAKKLDTTLQVCKAFVSATKEMKKEPKEIKKAKHIYTSLPLYSQSFEVLLKQLEEDEAILEELDSILFTREVIEDFDKISEMEFNLSQVKFYNVEKPRLILFKKKISLLISVQHEPESDLKVPYLVVKSMRVESNELLKKHELDEELENLNNFLNDVDNQAKNYMVGLSNVKNSATLDKVKRILMNFVDMSNEVLDLQAKIRVNTNRIMEGLSAREVNPPQRIGKIGAPVAQTPRDRRFNLTVGSVGATGDSKTREEEEQDKVPAYSATLNFRTSQGNKPMDMHTLRNSMLANLKIEIQRNAALRDTDAENFSVAQLIERSVFNRSLDGSYIQKMTKVLKLFQALVPFKRISMLLAAKNFDPDVLFLLMDKPFSLLPGLESDKEKLIKLIMTITNPPIPKAAVEEKNLKKRAPEPYDSEDEILGNIASDRDSDDSSEYIQRKPEQDTYKISKLKVARPTEEELKAKAAEEEKKKGRDSNESSNSLCEKGGHRGKGADGDEDGGRRNGRRKRRMKGKDGAEGGKGSEKPNEEKEVSKSDGIWSIFKGRITIKLDGQRTNIDYTDLVTFEAKNKVTNFPALPERIEFRKKMASQEFTKVMQGTLQCRSKSLTYLLGTVKVDPHSQASIQPLLPNDSTAYIAKYLPFAKIVMFPRSMMLPKWKPLINNATRNAFRVQTDFYWLIVLYMNLSKPDEKRTFTSIDPFPVYNIGMLPEGDNDASSVEQSEGDKKLPLPVPRVSDPNKKPDPSTIQFLSDLKPKPETLLQSLAGRTMGLKTAEASAAFGGKSLLNVLKSGTAINLESQSNNSRLYNNAESSQSGFHGQDAPRNPAQPLFPFLRPPGTRALTPGDQKPDMFRGNPSKASRDSFGFAAGGIDLFPKPPGMSNRI
jgi:hypothetical protein